MTIKRCETAGCKNPLSKLARLPLCASCRQKSRLSAAKIKCGNFAVCGNMIGPHGKTGLCRSCASRKRMKKLHSDPEFAKRNSDRSSKRMKKLHADRLAQKTSGLSPAELEIFNEYRSLEYTIDCAVFMARRDARRSKVA